MASGVGALRRSRADRVLSGVLGGVAEFLQLRPGRVRVAYVILSLLSAGFPGILLYLLLMYVIPEHPV